MTSSQHEADLDKATIDAYWTGRINQLRQEQIDGAFAYKPARDLRAGDVMWDASGPYRVTKVRRESEVVTFDVEGEQDFLGEGWQLGADEQVRVYV